MDAVKQAFEKTGEELRAYESKGWKVEFEAPYKGNPNHTSGVLTSPDGKNKYDFESYALDSAGNRVETEYGRKYWPGPWAKSPEDSLEASRLAHLVIFHDSLRRAVESPKKAA